MRLLTRMTLLIAACIITSPLVSAGEIVPIDRGTADKNHVWYDIHLVGVEGQGWKDEKAPFARLPAKAKGVVRAPVWSLSRHSAGLCARFATDASEIRCRWKLTSSSLAMPHMPATGVSGVDLYVKHEGRWRWLACGFPRAQSNSLSLVSSLPKGDRVYMLYLPLYNGVSTVEIGLPKAAKLRKAKSRQHAKPIVFYGTSITQGGCASRPGMVHTAILGRWLDRPVINLGFSGNGRMEAELAELMAEIDAEVFVIDCLPNINAAQVTARTAPLVKTLREKHPTTPIVLVEDRNYTNSFLRASSRDRNESNHKALRAVFEQLGKTDANLSYLPGANLLGDDNEGAVDGSHPTDLGFFRQSEVFRDHLRPILEKRN